MKKKYTFEMDLFSVNLKEDKMKRSHLYIMKKP